MIFRVISESVSCIETLLNQAYERNAVLESEVDEIENLRVKLQRATDEARGEWGTYFIYQQNNNFCHNSFTKQSLKNADVVIPLLFPDLKQELKVMELIPPHKKEDEENETPAINGVINNSRTHVEIETQTSITSPQKRKYLFLLNLSKLKVQTPIPK